MLSLLLQGQIALFAVMVVAIVISLTFHEFGHAAAAWLFGDNTAQRAGRLTLNPAAHIDPMGLLMTVLVGFGYARPVPTNPRNFKAAWADFYVSAAGPGMNLLLAVFGINFYLFGANNGWGFLQTDGAELFFFYFSLINLILMVFNLLPIGSLDGHYMLPYLLPRHLAQQYRYWNDLYGNRVLLGLMLLSIVGVPVFATISRLGEALLPMLVFV